MPTFSAIALDRLLEPGASKSVEKTFPSSKPVPELKPAPKSKLDRRHSSSTTVTEKKVIRPQIPSPALYATPDPTPLPDSPSSFPPSPYIINHKRRGPRLLIKSSSVGNVPSRQALDKEIENIDKKDSVINDIEPKKKIEHGNCVQCSSLSEKLADGTSEEEHMNGADIGEAKVFTNGSPKDLDVPKRAKSSVERGDEGKDFSEQQDSTSLASNTDVEDNGGAAGEFYDAWEELGSESGNQPSHRDLDTELRDLRSSLSTEIEKRKQAEEVLEDMRCRWQRIRQQLSNAGLTLAADPTVRVVGEPPDSDPSGEEICQQFHLARAVSQAIGKGAARAEMEMEMEAQIEAKNFEISRLLDRLKYYEAVNREMSQRNQEALEMTRRDRQRNKRIQKWVWGSAFTAITLGSAALSWSYLPSDKGSSATDNSVAPESK
ncbi:hypothetical protein ACFE04_003101 [Oxalis oulophora]